MFCALELSEKIKKIPQKPDTRMLLRESKKQVFKGLTFVFSGCFPIHVQPESTPEWKAANDFGAKCVRKITRGNPECVTHCIATQMGTSKVFEKIFFKPMKKILDFGP